MLKNKYLFIILSIIFLAALVSMPAKAAAAIPGTIQAESYNVMSGIQTENTSDTGGGQNIGWIDVGDWMDYNVTVQTTGIYTVNFRVASPYANTQLQLKNGTNVLATVTLPNTGGYQAWGAVSANVSLNAGSQTLRVSAVTNGWNFNWMSFTLNGAPTPTPTKAATATPTKIATVTPTPTNAATPTPGGDVLAAIVSSTASSAIQASSYSCDNLTGTRWESSHGSDPQWIYWDLGSSKSLSKITIEWEVASAANYTIQGSIDAASWVNLATVTNTIAVDHNKITTTLSGSYRYVRMYGMGRTTAYGYSIWETYIYILDGPTPTPKPTSTVTPTPIITSTPTKAPTATPTPIATPTPGGEFLSSVVAATASSALQAASYSCDGSTGTRWESVHGADPQWIYWDLGSNKNLSKITIEWEAASAAGYTIQGSTNTTSWTNLATVTNASVADHTKITTTLNGSYRYVRMYGTSRTTVYGYSIWETYIYVFTGPTPTPGPTSTPTPTPTVGPTPTKGPTPTPGNGTFPIVFQNNTRGYYADNQIYVRFFGMNAQGQWCYLKADGTMVPVNPNDVNASDHLTKNGINYAYYSFTLADTKVVNVPAHFTGGRCYISLGSPMYIPIGNNGWGGPDLLNPSDPNTDVVYDWYEFTYIYNQVPFGGNTTQVDQFGFPMTARLKQDSTGYDQTVGITMARDEIFRQYNTAVASPFQGLANTFRIVAPRSAVSFRSGGAYENYMQAYIDEVWNYYTTHQFVLGTYTGYVVNNRLQFYQNGAGPYYIDKPTTSDVMAGAGALARGNTIELALEAEFVAAFNRGVAMNTADWTNPAKYYLNPIKNDYAMFWHQIGIDGRAYGFSYDDVNDQSSVKILGNSNPPTSLTIGIGW